MGEIIQNFGFDVLFKGTNMLRLLQGLWAALRISLISVALSIGLGLAVGALMTVRNPVLKVLTRIYLEIVRIMPQMVLLFIVYFGTTRVFGWNLDAEISAVIVEAFPGVSVSKVCDVAEMPVTLRQHIGCRVEGNHVIDIDVFQPLPLVHHSQRNLLRSGCRVA